MVKYLPDGLFLALRLIFRIFLYVIAETLNLNDTILHAFTICPVILLRTCQERNKNKLKKKYK